MALPEIETPHPPRPGDRLAVVGDRTLYEIRAVLETHTATAGPRYVVETTAGTALCFARTGGEGQFLALEGPRP